MNSVISVKEGVTESGNDDLSGDIMQQQAHKFSDHLFCGLG